MPSLMVTRYLPVWQQLQTALLGDAEDPTTGEPIALNVRLDVKQAQPANGRPHPDGPIRCRIRVWAPEGNLMSAEIEHVQRIVVEARETTDMHGLEIEITNAGLEIKDVLLEN